MRPLYFDYNATTPVDPRVLEAMLPYFTEHFGNAESSQHAYGWKAKSAVETARAQVASLIGAHTNEIIFTSGSTESLALAILGFLETQSPARHVIASTAEHKAVLDACKRAQKLGHEVTLLPVNRFGQVEPSAVLQALKPNTALVSLMHANNEVGSITDVASIGAGLRARGEIAFHVDAAQTTGKVAIDVHAMHIDLLSLSGHKFYAPKGIGALYVRKPDIHVLPLMAGGGQERGLRGGTHNVPGIVGLGKACELCSQEMAAENVRLSGFRDRIIQATLDAGEGHVQLNGHPTERLCNNVHLTFQGLGSDELLSGLADIAFSTASACSAGAASHVLQAIGADTLSASARFGLGRFTTEDEVTYLIQKLTRLARNARGVSTGYESRAGEVPKNQEI